MPNEGEPVRDEGESRVPLVYVGIEDSPIILANQFGVIQDREGGEFILTVGQLQLPQLIGSDEDRLKQAEQLSYIAIKVVGRYGLTRPRVEALIDMLQRNLARTEDQTEPAP